MSSQVRSMQQTRSQAQRVQGLDRSSVRTITISSGGLPVPAVDKEYQVLQLQYPTRGDATSGALRAVWDWPRFHQL